MQSWVFPVRRFVRKIATVNPIPIPFSPRRSTQLILSYFFGKSYFQIPKTAYPRITYFPKTLLLKIPIFSQMIFITKQQVNTENQHAITHHNQLISFIKNHQHHNSTYFTIFIKTQQHNNNNTPNMNKLMKSLTPIA